MKLKDKVAVITGGAMGNGLGIARVFLKEGATVAILDYSDKLGNTINELGSLGNVCGFNVDIRDVKKVSDCMKAINDKYGHIYVVVNNDGVAKL